MLSGIENVYYDKLVVHLSDLDKWILFVHKIPSKVFSKLKLNSLIRCKPNKKKETAPFSCSEDCNTLDEIQCLTQEKTFTEGDTFISNR